MLLTSAIEFKHPSPLGDNPHEPGERQLVMDACSPSCKGLGECVYAHAAFSEDVMAASGAGQKCAFLTTGTTDIEVSREAMLFEDKLFHIELLLVLSVGCLQYTITAGHMPLLHFSGGFLTR